MSDEKIVAIVKNVPIEQINEGRDIGDEEKEPIICNNKEAKEAADRLIQYFEQQNLSEEIEHLVKIKQEIAKYNCKQTSIIDFLNE